MPTPHTKYRLERDTLDALARIAAQISAVKDGKPVTTVDVIRWLVALHDPKDNPGREYTPEELLGFPTVYSPEVRRAALRGPAGAADAGPSDTIPLTS